MLPFFAKAHFQSSLLKGLTIFGKVQLDEVGELADVGGDFVDLIVAQREASQPRQAEQRLAKGPNINKSHSITIVRVPLESREWV